MVHHFSSCRYLPPEIGCLKKLEELDLSFNKLKNLPNDIGELNALKSLRVANNKLVDLPSGISSLRRLENLDLSNNRLTSLTQLILAFMQTLQYLNLQVLCNTIIFLSISLLLVLICSCDMFAKRNMLGSSLLFFWFKRLQFWGFFNSNRISKPRVILAVGLQNNWKRSGNALWYRGDELLKLQTPNQSRNAVSLDFMFLFLTSHWCTSL